LPLPGWLAIYLRNNFNCLTSELIQCLLIEFDLQMSASRRNKKKGRQGGANENPFLDLHFLPSIA